MEHYKLSPKKLREKAIILRSQVESTKHFILKYALLILTAILMLAFTVANA